MAEALRWKSKLIRAKIESSYGVDPVPTQAILAKNVECSPMQGEEVTRDIERPFRGAQQIFPVGLRTTLKYDVEMVGGGAAGTASPISPVLRALGMAEVLSAGVDAQYTPVSENYDALAHYFWIGDNRQKILGCRGNATFNIVAQGIPFIRCEFTGLYAEPTATAVPSIDLSAFKAPLVSTTANTPVMTLNGVSLVMRSMAFNLNNDVKHRLLIGRNEIIIDDSNEGIDLLVEAVPLATLNPFALAASPANLVPFVVQQDTRAGYKVKVEAAQCQVKMLDAYQNEDGTLMWPLKLVPNPTDAGNDQFKVTIF